MSKSGIRIVLFLAVGLIAGSAFAETIELVTYYPVNVSTGQMETDRLHASRATIGDDPYSLTNPADANLPDGTLLVAGSVGIGTANPEVDLDIYRQDETYLRISGTGINATPENFSGIELGSDLPAGGVIDRLWQIAHKRGGAGGLNDLQVSYFDGAAWNPRVTIQPGGNVGIGTTTPQAAAASNGQATGNLDVNDIWLRNGNRWASQGGGGTNVVFRQGDGVQSGTNNAINETSTLTITLPAGTWVLQAHVQIHQSSARPLSLRINGAEVQSTDDSGTELEIITLFGIRQVVTVGAATVVPVTLVATSNFGLRENRAVNFMLIATQAG